jgi:hypothetical protein
MKNEAMQDSKVRTYKSLPKSRALLNRAWHVSGGDGGQRKTNECPTFNANICPTFGTSCRIECAR